MAHSEGPIGYLRLALFVVWLLLSGEIEFFTALVGMAISFLIVRQTWPLFFPDGTPGRIAPSVVIRRIASFFIYLPLFLVHVAQATLDVANHALARRVDVNPAILKVPISLKSPTSVMILANLITLTPGTMVIDYEETSNSLYVHCLDASVTKAEPLCQNVFAMEKWVRRILE